MVGLKNLLAVIFRQAVAEEAAFIDVAALVQLVLHSGVEVVGAMRRRRMHGSSALIGRDIVGQHPQDLPVQKRMSEGRIFQVAPQKTRNL